MEYGLRLERPGKLPSDPRDICEVEWRDLLPAGTLRALYFGTEFCEDMLPGIDEAEAFCAQSRDAGIEAVLLTPVVTSSGLMRLDALLAGLGRRNWSPTVTFNDWGVLTLLRNSYPHLICKAGRLLNRGLRDPRMAEEFKVRLTADVNKGEKQRALLLRFGVSGVETDPDLDGCYLEAEHSKLQRALHLPYSFTASGRNCLLKADSKTADESFSKGLGRGCSSPCRGQSLRVKRQDTDLPLWRAGNTIFSELPRSLVAAQLQRCDRIVLHERPLP